MGKHLKNALDRHIGASLGGSSQARSRAAAGVRKLRNTVGRKKAKAAIMFNHIKKSEHYAATVRKRNELMNNNGRKNG